jgi:hypothetical protein
MNKMPMRLQLLDLERNPPSPILLEAMLLVHSDWNENAIRVRLGVKRDIVWAAVSRCELVGKEALVKWAQGQGLLPQ